MALAEFLTLTSIGSGIVSWGLGKSCDTAIDTSQKGMRKLLKNKGLDPNHDIEAAILTAHYQALEFIVEDSFSQKNDKRVQSYSARLKHLGGKAGFRRIYQDITDRNFEGLLMNMAGDWQSVIPANFETADALIDVHQAIPSAYVLQAKADLLSLAVWSEPEKEALSERVMSIENGWIPAFSACLRKQIKENGPFRHIYMAQLQEHQLAHLEDISARLSDLMAPNAAFAEAMVRVEQQLERIETGVEDANARLARIETKVDLIVAKGHYANEVGHQYPRYLAKMLIKTDVAEADWEAEITAALTRYVEGKAQLEKHTQLPHHLDAKRAEALALYEEAKLDEGEAILQNLIETVTRERLETAARDHAYILIDQVPFATAKLDYNRAMDLYEEAAQAVLVTDKRQAIDWLWDGARLGKNRGKLFGEGFLKRSESCYQIALSQTLLKNGVRLPEFKDDWASLQNNLGNVYGVLGERGEEGALQRAVKAYKAALTVRTKEAAPMKWAMTQNNVGNAYRVLGERGEKGALERTVKAYEAALTVHTKGASPMVWATIQNNLGAVYKLLGARGTESKLAKAVTAYEEALTVRTKEAAPMDWAITQNNLGNAYQLLGKRGDDGALDNAVKAYEAALTVCTKEAAPMQWAMTQNNLGNAYLELGKLGDDGALDNAVKAYEAALTVRTKEAAPMQWAMTQNNLGNAYQVLSKRGDDGAWGKAVMAYEAALTVHTKDAASMDWAKTTENMGYVFWGQDKTEKAEACFRDTLTIYRELGASWYINKLENAMRSRGIDI